MIIRETLKIFLENVYDRVFLVKLLVYSVQTATLSIKRLLHIFFSEYISKASCLKKNILTKNSMVDQGFKKVEQFYQCRQFYQKIELMLDPTVEAPQILMYLQENFLGGGFFSSGLEFISAI